MFGEVFLNMAKQKQLIVGGHSLEKLPLEFYVRTDVVQIARDLLGKVLVTEFDGVLTAGFITETEAYWAPDDRACHAYGNRRTARTEVMFHEGGVAYVYICYGIHHLFNVVTGPENTAHAVLIRAIEPVEGLSLMYERRGYPAGKPLKPALTTGPGSAAQALGIHASQSGLHLVTGETGIWIGDQGISLPEHEIGIGKRIGVESAGTCADRPWRFWWNRSRFYK